MNNLNGKTTSFKEIELLAKTARKRNKNRIISIEDTPELFLNNTAKLNKPVSNTR